MIEKLREMIGLTDRLSELLREQDQAAPTAPAALPWVKIVEGGPRPEPHKTAVLFFGRDMAVSVWGSWTGTDWVVTDSCYIGQDQTSPTHYLVITKPED